MTRQRKSRGESDGLTRIPIKAALYEGKSERGTLLEEKDSGGGSEAGNAVLEGGGRKNTIMSSAPDPEIIEKTKEKDSSGRKEE